MGDHSAPLAAWRSLAVCPYDYAYRVSRGTRRRPEMHHYKGVRPLAHRVAQPSQEWRMTVCLCLHRMR